MESTNKQAEVEQNGSTITTTTTTSSVPAATTTTTTTTATATTTTTTTTTTTSSYNETPTKTPVHINVMNTPPKKKKNSITPAQRNKYNATARLKRMKLLEGMTPEERVDFNRSENARRMKYYRQARYAEAMLCLEKHLNASEDRCSISYGRAKVPGFVCGRVSFKFG
jgi:hypothetical protein